MKKKSNEKRSNENKTWCGMPVNLEPQNIKNMFKPLWNKTDDRLFPPKSFGVGWSINFHALLRHLGVIEDKT